MAEANPSVTPGRLGGAGKGSAACAVSGVTPQTDVQPNAAEMGFAKGDIVKGAAVLESQWKRTFFKPSRSKPNFSKVLKVVHDEDDFDEDATDEPYFIALALMDLFCSGSMAGWTVTNKC